jgi:hypothetical protein
MSSTSRAAGEAQEEKGKPIMNATTNNLDWQWKCIVFR